jgi:hypothetical protein
MTVLTMPPQPAQDSKPQPVPWRRMAWVTWCQHRATLISVPAVLGAVAVFLWIAGLKIHRDYAVLTACHPVTSAACQNLSSLFTSTDWTIGNTVNILVQLAPALIGAFAGAPVLARELETGTFRYAWTQGLGRERQTVARLALLAIVITATAQAFSQMYNWFFRPFLAQQGLTDLDASVFITHGIAFAAWTLVAFIIGAFLGMLIRRILPAMAATLGTYLGLYALTWLVLRKHYLPALVTSHVSTGFSGRGPASAPWVLGASYTGPGGKPARMTLVSNIIAQFQQVHGGPSDGPVPALAQHGITQWWTYIPVSRFWPMQFVEAGWLLALCLILIMATVWLVRRRAA